MRAATGLGDRLDTLRVDVEPLPADVFDRYAGFLAGGSPFNVSDPEAGKSDAQRAAEERLTAIAAGSLERDRPAFFTCYGIGLVTRLLGGRVDRTHPERVSAVEDRLTDAGAADPDRRGAAAALPGADRAQGVRGRAAAGVVAARHERRVAGAAVPGGGGAGEPVPSRADDHGVHRACAGVPVLRLLPARGVRRDRRCGARRGGHACPGCCSPGSSSARSCWPPPAERSAPAAGVGVGVGVGVAVPAPGSRWACGVGGAVGPGVRMRVGFGVGCAGFGRGRPSRTRRGAAGSRRGQPGTGAAGPRRRRPRGRTEARADGSASTSRRRGDRWRGRVLGADPPALPGRSRPGCARRRSARPAWRIRRP